VNLFCNCPGPSFCVCSQVVFLFLEMVGLMSCALWHCCVCIVHIFVCFELEPMCVARKLPAFESGSRVVFLSFLNG
jgi:hypothetical protein